MTILTKYIRREDGSERELSPREYEAIDYYGEDIAIAFPPDGPSGQRYVPTRESNI